MYHVVQHLKIDMSHLAVKLVYGDGTIGDAGIVFWRIRCLDSRGTEMVKVVDARYEAKYGMVGLWTANDTFPILYSKGAASLVNVMEQSLVSYLILLTMPLLSYQINYPTLQFGCYGTVRATT